jgi:molybdopterin-containing oxidoreductase family iron-sulfur binding subunit
LFFDETATLSHWHIPAAHYLEAWSDARSIDGTVSIVQPLIQPLYGGKSAHEIVATMSDRPERAGYDVVREYWQANAPKGAPAGASGAMSASGAQVPSAAPGTNAQRTSAPAAPSAPPAPTAADQFEKSWRKWLHDGVIAGSATMATTTAAATVAPDVATRITQSANADGLEINFRHDPTIYDGRFANNGWLQELPKPMSKMTWDMTAHVSPEMPNSSSVYPMRLIVSRATLA